MKRILIYLFFCIFNISFANNKIDLKLVFILDTSNRVGSEDFFKSQSAAFNYAIDEIKKDAKYNNNLNIKFETLGINCKNLDKDFASLKDANIILNVDNIIFNNNCLDNKPNIVKDFIGSNVLSFSFASFSKSSFKDTGHQIFSMFESIEDEANSTFDFLIKKNWDNLLIIKGKNSDYFQSILVDKLKAAKKTIYTFDINGDDIRKVDEDKFFANWNPKLESILWFADGKSFIHFERLLNKKGLSKNEKILGDYSLCQNDIVNNVIGSNVYCRSTSSYDVEIHPDAPDAMNIIDRINKTIHAQNVIASDRIIRSYVLPYIIADAALKAGSGDGRVLKEIIINNRWQTAIGSVGFSKEGFFDKSPLIIKKLNRKKQHDIVYPPQFVN